MVSEVIYLYFGVVCIGNFFYRNCFAHPLAYGAFLSEWFRSRLLVNDLIWKEEVLHIIHDGERKCKTSHICCRLTLKTFVFLFLPCPPALWTFCETMLCFCETLLGVFKIGTISMFWRLLHMVILRLGFEKGKWCTWHISCHLDISYIVFLLRAGHLETGGLNLLMCQLSTVRVDIWWSC